MNIDAIVSKNLLPDSIVRFGIRSLLAQRLKEEDRGSFEKNHEHFLNIVQELKQSPIAINTKDANEQHYEVPTAFYVKSLGKRLKYSSAYWNSETKNLDQAEEVMLAKTCERAELKDGQDVLELGCGWGSLSLWMAEHYPKSSFTVVSNSKTQKIHIDEQARQRGLVNLRVITADMNTFELDQQFDRVVSVEMFEHMRNYQLLRAKVSRMLKPEGKLFVHIFTHKYFAYYFEDKDPNDWLTRYFFSGGIMPSDHLLLYFQDDLTIDKHWRVNGQHYEKTANAWLENMDTHRKEIYPLFEVTYGKENALKWWSYWRVFFMACAELWGYKNGEEWFVSHYLFKKK
jgi:cyclopropane-fatty-acyl-phospholipid synthase